MRSLRRSVQDFLTYKVHIVRRASSVEYTWKNYNVERRTDFAKVLKYIFKFCRIFGH